MKQKRRLILFIMILTVACIQWMPASAVSAAELNLQAQAALVMDAQTGEILYEKDIHTKREPASTTTVSYTHLDVYKRQVSVITMVYPDGEKIVARGEVEGHLVLEEKGSNGFGYDPLFVPLGYDITFGEFEPEEKNKISHRGNALKALKQQLEEKNQLLMEK